MTDRLNLVGSVVDGRYLVEAEVGVGGFGVVYRARHIRFDSTVALKVLFRNDDSLSPSPVSPGQGTEEGRLQFQLAALHPSFVRVFETGLIVRDRALALSYLAMEWLEGITLKDYLESLIASKRSLELKTALHLFDDLAQAIAIAHARRVAHRDLKPANIYLVARDGQIVPKLLDFGVAKVGTAEHDGYEDTRHKTSPFTPAYAAPEQWDRSFGATGPWTDVYAFALVLVEIIVGRRWYTDDKEPQFGRRTLDAQNRPTPKNLGLDVNDAIETVFTQALALSPRERYADMRAFWDALRLAAQFERPHALLRLDTLGLELPDRPVQSSKFTETLPPVSSHRHRNRTEEHEEPPSSISPSSVSPESRPDGRTAAKRFGRALATVFTGAILMGLTAFALGRNGARKSAVPLISATSACIETLPPSLERTPRGGTEVLVRRAVESSLGRTPSTTASSTPTKAQFISPDGARRQRTRPQLVTDSDTLHLLPELTTRNTPPAKTAHSPKHTIAKDLVLDTSLSTRK